MTLFLILICIGLQRQLGLNPNRMKSWLALYVSLGNKLHEKWHLNSNVLFVLLLLLPLTVIIAILQYLLEGVWFNIPNFLFQGIVLFFSINACNIKKHLTHYFKAREENDEQAAFHYGLDFLQKTSADDLVTLTRAITIRIFQHADFYLFSVLFWYIILGPVAAVVYAVTRFLAEEKSCFYIPAQKIHTLLDWLPARFTAMGYALAGNFSYAFAYIRQYLLTGPSSSRNLPLEAGLATLRRNKNDVALADQEENLEALDLVDRSLMIWIVVIALFTLTAWIA